MIDVNTRHRMQQFTRLPSFVKIWDQWPRLSRQDVFFWCENKSVMSACYASRSKDTWTWARDRTRICSDDCDCSSRWNHAGTWDNRKGSSETVETLETDEACIPQLRRRDLRSSWGNPSREVLKTKIDLWESRLRGCFVWIVSEFRARRYSFNWQ